MEKIVAVDGGYFHAAIIAKDGLIIKAAPILKYMIGWNAVRFVNYCKKKKWKIISI